MESMKTISVHELHDRLPQGARLIDVREFPEYVGAHLENAQLIPLGELRRNLPEIRGEVFLLCRSGRRAREAATLLGRQPDCRPIVVEGGMDAWQQAGFPVQREKGPISLERQVRIAAGSLVLLGLFVPPVRFLSYFVGGGLIFAGVTDLCGMALLLAKLPWNRRQKSACSAAKPASSAP